MDLHSHKECVFRLTSSCPRTFLNCTHLGPKPAICLVARSKTAIKPPAPSPPCWLGSEENVRIASRSKAYRALANLYDRDYAAVKPQRHDRFVSFPRLPSPSLAFSTANWSCDMERHGVSKRERTRYVPLKLAQKPVSMA